MTMDFTLLTEKQIWGDAQKNGQLQIMKDYGTKTGMSDLAIILGGFMGTGKTSDNQRAGNVWSASSVGDGDVRTVYCGGARYYDNPNKRGCGARPALPTSVTSSIEPSEARLTKKISGVDIVEYGEYPQTIAADDASKELESAFVGNQLKVTGKKYTFDGEKYDACDQSFKAKEYVEYEHRGKRYIRVEAQSHDNDSVLSNGKTPQEGKPYWIEVQPIEWLVEPENIKNYQNKRIRNPNAGLWLARQALFAGVQFDRNQRYDGDFENTDMKRYLTTYFAKDMQVSREQGKSVKTERPLSWEERARVTTSTITDLTTGATAELKGGTWVDATGRDSGGKIGLS